MSARGLFSVEEREEKKAYVRIDWWDDASPAWAGLAMGRTGQAVSVFIAGDEEGDALSAVARTALEVGDFEEDMGEPAPSWATHAVVTTWAWLPTLGGWKRWRSWLMRRNPEPGKDEDEWEEISEM